MSKFSINSFKSGINQSFDDSLIKHYEAYNAQNCDISRGTLKTKSAPSQIKALNGNHIGLLAYYDNISKKLLYSSGGKITINGGADIVTGHTSDKYDFLNFYKKDKNIIIFANGKEQMKYYDGTSVFPIKNRRPAYDEKTGALIGYYDANNVLKKTEAEVQTFAPIGKFIELHYDRLWVGGVSGKEDIVYFSTAGRDGADIEDFTSPIEENEANMHGGFIDFSSYDGGKVIGLKVVGNDIYVFKERTLFRVFGSSPSSYTKVQIFNSNGAIANDSIVTGANRCFFLNHNNIYEFDGVNINPIGEKVRLILNRMNKSYADKACGIFYDDKYYIAVPLDNSTENNCVIEYNTLTGAFMVYMINVQSFLEFDKKLYYSNSTGIYDFNSPSNVVLPLLWESAFIEFNKNIKKSFDYFYAVSTGSFKVTLITEKKSKELVFDSTRMKKKLKNKGKTFKIRIESIGVPFELSTPEWIFEEDED